MALPLMRPLAYQGNNLTITKALLNVIADARTKVYGDADPALTYQVSGLKNGDTAGAVLNGGSLSRVAGENVGVYGINQGGLGLVSANYDLSYQGNNLTITKALLNVIADAKTKVYGDADPSLTYGIGRLGAIEGARDSLVYRYDERGNLVEQVRSIRLDQQTLLDRVTYRYDAANQLLEIGYPSGLAIGYPRNAGGQVASVTLAVGDKAPSPLVGQIAYLPFGPLQRLTWGNGIAYDAVGNRTQRSDNPASGGTASSQDYQYAPDSNRLTAIGAQAVTSDAAGNLTQDRAARKLAYDAQGRLQSVSLDGQQVAEYRYNALGQRIVKLTPESVTTYLYGPDGHLVGTEQGVGVRLAGDMAASGGDIRIDASGKLSLAQASSQGDLKIAAQAVELNGKTYAGGSAEIRSAEELVNRQSLAARERIALEAAHIDNAGVIEAGVEPDERRNAGVAPLVWLDAGFDHPGVVEARGVQRDAFARRQALPVDQFLRAADLGAAAGVGLAIQLHGLGRDLQVALAGGLGQTQLAAGVDADVAAAGGHVAGQLHPHALLGADQVSSLPRWRSTKRPG